MAVLSRPKYAIHPEGEAILGLVGVDVRRVKSQYPDGKENDGCAAMLVWTFMSETENDDGVPFQMRSFTPTVISSKNRTGDMARMLEPGINPDSCEFDPDMYIGRRFKAIIANKPDRNGVMRDSIVSLKPVKPAQRVAAPADDDDVFGDA